MIEIIQNTDNLSLKEAMITELDITKTEQIGLNSKKVLKKRIEQRRHNHTKYRSMLISIGGLKLQKENNKDFYSNFWLNCITIESCLGSKSKLMRTFSEKNIDVRTFWTPLHLQKHLQKALYFGDQYSRILFDSGLCLPSSSNLTNEEFDRIHKVFKSLIDKLL